MKASRTLLCCLAALVASGCVSQQSTLDFGGTTPSQSVPIGVNIANNFANQPAPATNQFIASNIPTKAPRANNSITAQQVLEQPVAITPSTVAVVSDNSQAVAAINAPQAAPSVSVVPTPALGISETQPAQTATANVIAAATTQPAIAAQPVAKAVPATIPIIKPSDIVSPNKPKVQRTPRVNSRTRIASLGTERPSRPTASKRKVKRPSEKIAKPITQRSSTKVALPGVKSNSEIFGIKDEGPNISSPTTNNTQVAAVGSFGKLSPNGLRVQHSKVQVACLKPELLRILKQVERKYSKKPIVTSGYRSPKGNRSAGGARNSQHIFCKAVDIQVEGVSKWQLAKYLRTLSGRGGVGTYCRTKSVHIDIGSKRDWHHPCRKSSKRKRKKV